MVSTPKTNQPAHTLDLEAFADYLVEQDRSPVTVRGYLSDIRIFANWAAQLKEELFGLHNWTAGDVRRYRQFLNDSGAKPHTINRKLAALVAFGHWAVQSGKLGQNPALNVRNVESVPLAPKWLDKRQRAALVRAVENDLRLARQRYPRLWVMRLRDAVMTLMLLNTGLRVGELCALNIHDVQVSGRKGSVTVRSGKGLKQRTVPLNGPARQLLSEWLAARPEGCGEALFVGQRGGSAPACALCSGRSCELPPRPALKMLHPTRCGIVLPRRWMRGWAWRKWQPD